LRLGLLVLMRPAFPVLFGNEGLLRITSYLFLYAPCFLSCKAEKWLPYNNSTLWLLLCCRALLVIEKFVKSKATTPLPIDGSGWSEIFLSYRIASHRTGAKEA
jgi:hypothetical protein